MLGFLIKKIIGSRTDRELKKYRPVVTRTNEIEATYQALPLEALQKKTADWKAKLSAIADDKELARALEGSLPGAVKGE